MKRLMIVLLIVVLIVAACSDQMDPNQGTEGVAPVSILATPTPTPTPPPRVSQMERLLEKIFNR